MDEKATMLIGLDIHKLTEGLCNQLLGVDPKMTNREQKAYKLGIQNTLGLLEQLLHNMQISDDGVYDANTVIVNVPGMLVPTEFLTIEEISDVINEELNKYEDVIKESEEVNDNIIYLDKYLNKETD